MNSPMDAWERRTGVGPSERPSEGSSMGDHREAAQPMA